MKRRHRVLSREEQELWERVQASVAPLLKRKPSAQQTPAAAPEAEPMRAAIEKAERKLEAALPALPKPTPTPRLQGFDLKTQRRIAKGRIALDARIDLHDMTQAEAHARLFGFLSNAQTNGVRHVLVITGKGGSLMSDGVLRRVVPQWFATPAFRSVVAGYDEANRRHGGGGALYVRLKRKDRPA